MNKDGFFAKLLTEKIEREKKKYKTKPMDLFTDQKRQIWYLMMNQMDSAGKLKDEKTAESISEI